MITWSANCSTLFSVLKSIQTIVLPSFDKIDYLGIPMMHCHINLLCEGSLKFYIIPSNQLIFEKIIV